RSLSQSQLTLAREAITPSSSLFRGRNQLRVWPPQAPWREWASRAHEYGAFAGTAAHLMPPLSGQAEPSARPPPGCIVQTPGRSPPPRWQATPRQSVPEASTTADENGQITTAPP